MGLTKRSSSSQNMSNDIDFTGGAITITLRGADAVQRELKAPVAALSDMPSTSDEMNSDTDLPPSERSADLIIPSAREEPMLQKLARVAFSAVVKILREEAAKLLTKTPNSTYASEEDIVLLANKVRTNAIVPRELDTILRMPSEAISIRLRVLDYYDQMGDAQIPPRVHKIASHQLVLTKMREAYNVLSVAET